MDIQLRRVLRRLANALRETGDLRRLRPVDGCDVATTFVQWTYLRAVFHRGYVLASGLYFVVDAHLSASQIVFLGTVMSATLVLTDIPTGVWADALGRKWPLVIGHLFLAAGMAMTGVVTAFPLILVTQVLWGVGWAFLTGADVAWVTDELAQPHRIARVLTASARWELAGGATGMIAFGVLSWATSLATAIVVSGVGMALLGLFVAARFTERNFLPTKEKRWSASLSTFRLGVSLLCRDHEILLVCVATMIVNGAAVVGWLFPKQIVNLGFPSDPVLWYTAVGLCSSAAGVVALHIVQARIDGVGVARHIYALTCFIGVLGLLVLAEAPDAIIGGAGVLLVSGIAFNVTRTVSVIWVNRRTTSDVRATVRSFLDQAESIGEICGGFALAAIAGVAGISIALLISAALIAFTGMMVALSSADRASPGSR
ncbi:MFS transporter [Ktedonobacter racemifer]|uniref:Major facilitator superfamily MFS_1 n=1 Tax=Ktedonobacter racemifer DSM 44963 TaxID=485913 RepID=D6TE73_KTERA|nr:MFS transporter [Ktedonobacter racemifer]EFH88446.1 major facilitator superfamily MFS_1 [Ktedonobacter racemifer DSM 44963]